MQANTQILPKTEKMDNLLKDLKINLCGKLEQHSSNAFLFKLLDNLLDDDFMNPNSYNKKNFDDLVELIRKVPPNLYLDNTEVKNFYAMKARSLNEINMELKIIKLSVQLENSEITEKQMKGRLAEITKAQVTSEQASNLFREVNEQKSDFAKICDLIRSFVKKISKQFGFFVDLITKRSEEKNNIER